MNNSLKQQQPIVVVMHEEDWITPEEACKLMRGGKGINLDSFMNRIYEDRLPKNSYVKTATGWKIHKQKLTGFLRRTTHLIAA
jgi:hypothetical protein